MGADRCPGCGVAENVVHKPGCYYGMAGQGVTVNLPPQVGGGITIKLPPEAMQYQHEIRRFVEAMVFKLVKHSAKGRWEKKTIGECLELLDGEVKELHEALERGNMVETLLEAADVANYALIISAIVMERGK